MLSKLSANVLEYFASFFPNNDFCNFQTSRCERRINQLQQLNEQPLYPTEKVIWDENLVPYDQYNGEGKFCSIIYADLLHCCDWKVTRNPEMRVFHLLPNLFGYEKENSLVNFLVFSPFYRYLFKIRPSTIHSEIKPTLICDFWIPFWVF